MKEHTFGTELMIAIVVCLLFLLPAVWAQQPKPGGTLRVAYEADVTGLDPHLSPGIQAWHVVGNLFNGLLTIDPELNFVPDFDAEAVRWNYQRVVDPEEKTLDAPYYNGLVDTVEAIDAHTVTFTLKHPTRTLLAALAADRVGFLQMSPAAYKKWGREDVRLHPVGTGPFKLAKWEQNQVIALEKNPHYFKPGRPYLDRIELRIMKDGVTRATALRTGEVDFLNYVPKEMVERLSKESNIQLLRAPDTQSVNISFHNSRKPFDDVRVRQALGGYGIDRHAIAKTAMLGLGQAPWSFVPPGARITSTSRRSSPTTPSRRRSCSRRLGLTSRIP